MGTIALDSSALLAMLLKEADGPRLEEIASGADRLLLSAINYMETGIVWDNQAANPPTNPEKLDHLLAALDVEIVAVSQPMAQAARAAYKRFGKGNHEARLNLGDCFAYALAKSYDAPLLFKGTDFEKTDIGVAF